MKINCRVRGFVTTDFSSLMLIKRTRPGAEPYWVFPGGGLEESDESEEAAVIRELSEELGASVQVISLAFVFERQTEPDVITKELFYLCKLISQDAGLQTGEEFSDPSRGGYDLEWVPLKKEVLSSLNIKPEEVKAFLLEHAGELSDLRDLREQ